jgi:hypothetical protein
MSDMRSDLTVSLWRGAHQGRYETYSVPLRENQTVLDVVTFVQRHLDPTLSYRFACRVGVCGSCAMTVNGRPRWTCRTHVSSVAKRGRLDIGPLENLPIIKDLVTDTPARAGLEPTPHSRSHCDIHGWRRPSSLSTSDAERRPPSLVQSDLPDRVIVNPELIERVRKRPVKPDVRPLM